MMQFRLGIVRIQNKNRFEYICIDATNMLYLLLRVREKNTLAKACLCTLSNSPYATKFANEANCYHLRYCRQLTCSAVKPTSEE